MPRSPVIPRDDAIRRLHAWGYFPRCVDAVQAAADVGPAEFEEALRRYQALHGLVPDGDLGPKTAHLMNNPLRCGLPDFLGEGDCAWPMKRVTYFSRLRLGLTDASSVFEQAARQWNAVCGIELIRVETQSCNILAEEGNNGRDELGHRGGVLAFSYMPCHATRTTRLQQKYDVAETWSDSMLLAVACHELGHAIGIPHLAAGALMQPYYSQALTRPQEADIREAVKRYGPPANAPQPAPPDAVETGTLFLSPGGQRCRVTVTVTAIREAA